MNYVQLAKEKTKYFCDNLHDGLNQMFITIETDEELFPLIYDTIGETFYEEMARLRPDVINILFSGKMVDNVLIISVEATI
jgi:hypothetical protein